MAQYWFFFGLILLALGATGLGVLVRSSTFGGNWPTGVTVAFSSLGMITMWVAGMWLVFVVLSYIGLVMLSMFREEIGAWLNSLAGKLEKQYRDAQTHAKEQ